MKKYYIYSRKHTSHEPVWWGPDDKGYWTELTEAGLYAQDNPTVVSFMRPGESENIPISEEVIKQYSWPIPLEKLEAMLAGHKESALEKCSRSIMARNAVKNMSRKNQRRPLWCLIQEICGVGSTTATMICRELNLDPDKKVSDQRL